MRSGIIRILPLLICAALLSGCAAARPPLVTPPGSSLPPPVPPTPPVPDAKLKEIVEAYAARKRWSRKGVLGKIYISEKADREKAFFVRRRVPWLHIAHSSWVNETGFTQLFARLDAEVAVVESYLSTTTTAIVDATDGPPTHLDLEDVARMKTVTTAGRAHLRSLHYLALRKKRIATIVWGALGIHGNLWQPGTGAPALDVPAVNQVLDMRLRMIERLNFQISSHKALMNLDRTGAEFTRMDAQGPNGPWIDGWRVRMFEYPRVGKFLYNVIGREDIWGEATHLGVPFPRWMWGPGKEELVWAALGDGTIRFAQTTANDVEADWTGKPHHHRFLKPTATGGAAAAMARLFTPAADWWERSWLYCDHVLAALQLEGLRFALRRRFGNDDAFNALPSRATPSYLRIGSTMGGDRLPSTGYILSDVSNDPYFDKQYVFVEELQVGDHLVMWNSFVYDMVTAGEWSLENALVLDLDGDPIDGSFDRRALTMQGHGTGALGYGEYQANIAGKTAGGMKRAQKAAVAAAGANPARSEFTLQNDFVAVRWDPYEPLAAPGAWWIRVPVPDLDDLQRWLTVGEALVALPKAVADQAPNAGPGYHPPPMGNQTQAVFFPLFEPKLPGPDGRKNLGWTRYFEVRRTSATAPLPTRLLPVVVDGSMCPGLFFRGGSTLIPIIRPKAR